jgi:hypothetical protein
MPTDNGGKKIDYLTEDAPIPNQAWACVSFLSPEGIRNCTVRGLKIRGIYATKEEADDRAKDLQQIDPDFHGFVGEVGKWLPWDPDPNDVKDQVYKEQELQDLMKGYKDNLAKAQRIQQQRKTDMMKEATIHEQNAQQPSGNKTKDRLRKKLEARKQQQRTNKFVENQEKQQSVEQAKKTLKELELEAKEQELDEKEKMTEADRLSLQETQKALYEKNKNLENIDERLQKINDLYAKLNKKKSATEEAESNTN